MADHGGTLFQGSQQSVESLRRCICAFKNAGAMQPKWRSGVLWLSVKRFRRRAARPAAEELTAGYRRTGEQVKRRVSTEDELDTKRWMNEVAIIGSPHTVAARIAALYAELGFGSIQLVRGLLSNLPQTDVVRTIELFAKEPKPLVQSMLSQAK